MKPVFATSLLLPFLFAGEVLFAQQTEKTLVKSFNLEGRDLVAIDIPEASVEIKTWNSPDMRVQMTIGLANFSEGVLKGLVTAGRYNLKGEAKDDQLVITASGLKKQVMINGQEVKEKISLLVYVPEKVAVKAAVPGTTSDASKTSHAKLASF